MPQAQDRSQDDPSPQAGYTEADLAYVRAEYRTLDELCADRPQTPQEIRELVAAGRLPRSAYVLPDGTEMFPPDYFALVDSAGGVEQLRAHFDDRHRVATTMLGTPGVDPEEDWVGYLSGQYGVCLREVTPEAMVEKSALIALIESLVAVPRPDDDAWRTQLASAVDDLDEVERPFTDHDRQRWGGTSRDTHITAVRARFLA